VRCSVSSSPYAASLITVSLAILGFAISRMEGDGTPSGALRRRERRSDGEALMKEPTP